VVQGKITLVISPMLRNLSWLYGSRQIVVVSTNSPWQFHGESIMELGGPFGKVIDRFWCCGEDGFSTNHEFEDAGP